MAKKKPLVHNHVPRILAILYIVFLSLFALDAGSVVGLLIHLTPQYFLIATLIIAWKKPKMGGTLFMAISITFLAFFNAYKEVVPFVLLSLIPFSIGVLFYLSDKKSR